MPTIKFKPKERIAYDKAPVQVKVLPGVRERLMAIDHWQDKLRRCIDELISNELRPSQPKGELPHSSFGQKEVGG